MEFIPDLAGPVENLHPEHDRSAPQVSATQPQRVALVLHPERSLKISPGAKLAGQGERKLISARRTPGARLSGTLDPGAVSETFLHSR